MPEDFIDSYRTLASPAEHEIKIKGSRFIALGFPATDESEALSHLEQIRKKEFSATHHCFAYTVGIDKEVFKYSDDGEPTGTAGKPIYLALTGRELKNVIAIVVRYFGGTKLGTGGLTRAYAQATIEMLDKAEIVERFICDTLSFTIPFQLYDRLLRIIHTGQYTIANQEFAEDVSMVIEIRKSKTDLFRNQLIELSGGKIVIEKNG